MSEPSASSVAVGSKKTGPAPQAIAFESVGDVKAVKVVSPSPFMRPSAQVRVSGCSRQQLLYLEGIGTTCINCNDDMGGFLDKPCEIRPPARPVCEAMLTLIAPVRPDGNSPEAKLFHNNGYIDIGVKPSRLSIIL